MPPPGEKAIYPLPGVISKPALWTRFFIKIHDSQTLLDNLEDFGKDELEKMHRADELEDLV